MKGGIDALSSEGLVRMLETYVLSPALLLAIEHHRMQTDSIDRLDLLHAAMFESPLVFTSAKAPPTSTAYVESGLPDAEIFTRLMPLLVAEQKDFHRDSDSIYNEKLRGLDQLLTDAASATKGAMADDSIPNCLMNDPVFVTNWSSHLEEFHQRSCLDDPTARDALYLARVCHACMMLFHNTLTGVPGRAAINQPYVDSIWIAMRTIKDSTWKPLPYMRLLILLRALVSSSDISRKSFLKAQLVRAIHQLGGREWKRVKNFIVKYLYMTRVLQRPSRESPDSHTTRGAEAEGVVSLDWRARQDSGSDGAPLSRAATIDLATAAVPSNGSRAPSPSQYAWSLPTSPYYVEEDPFPDLH